MKNKTVYVLGAGFSKEAGFPLTKEFTDKKTISKFRKNLNKSEQKRLDKVSKYFRNRIDNKYCKDDIESVLNHIAVADYLDMESTHRIHKLGTEWLNDHMKERNEKVRYLTFYDTISVSEEAKERITQIINEDGEKSRLK